MNYFVISTYKTTDGTVANPTVTRYNDINSAEANFHKKLGNLISEATTVMASVSLVDELQNVIKHDYWVKAE